MPKLIDLGERKILREIIPKWCSPAGDDCAAFSVEAGKVVITTDPVPPPAAAVLGGDNDPYWLGWLLVTINASDIAASGAIPRAFVAALDLPREMEVERFERILAGIKDSCAANSLEYVGGNLREAEAIRAVGTAIGFCTHPPLSRSGAKEGDLIGVFGKLGNFWSDVFRIRAGNKIDKVKSNLFAPVSQSSTIHKFAKLGLLKCCMDASDGLAPTFEELARVNGVRINIDKHSIEKAADLFDRNLGIRACMGWGDWLVVAAISPQDLDQVSQESTSLGAQFAVCGTCETGQGVYITDHGQFQRLGKLESERFVLDSWFTAGIESYIERMKSLSV